MDSTLSRIIQLDPITSNKIAAGEVVEKPSAVVKELVENSIDAGSSQITVEVQQGGKTLIRVSDNGSGIHYDDLNLAFERHATSKIKTIQDLYQIQTLGFRGEALASIASVSILELITKTASSSNGYRLEMHGGKSVSTTEIGAPLGTSISVKDLFFNTPARLKFLKSNGAELTIITDWISRLAISHPDISVRFIADHKDIFMTSGNGNLLETIAAVYEKNLAKSLIPIDASEDIHIIGYLGDLNCNRGNRQMQHFYVNGRSVKNNLLSEALELGYQGLLPVNRFPICFLNIVVDAEKLDVNIHPAKIQIRFQEEQLVRQNVFKSVKSCLLNHDLMPKVRFAKTSTEKNLPIVEQQIPDKSTGNTKLTDSITEKTALDCVAKENAVVYNVSNIVNEEPLKTLESLLTRPVNVPDPITLQNVEPIPKETLYEGLTIIGQAFNTYILAEKNHCLYLIDQHAAHEKILYEHFLEGWKKSYLVTQVLLVPEVVHMNPRCILQSNELQPVLNRAGFIYETFGHDAIVVRETPLIGSTPLPANFIKNLIQDFSEELNNGITLTDIRSEKIIQESCKKAIKAFDILHHFEMNSLLSQLKQLESPYTCPHGRPIIISIDKSELEKRFKRT